MRLRVLRYLETARAIVCFPSFLPHVAILSQSTISCRLVQLRAVTFVSTLCIFIRTCYRLAELSMGLDSNLANDEVAFLVPEGVMVAIAVISLSISHPGVAFQGLWDTTDFRLVDKRPLRVDSQTVLGNDIEFEPHNRRYSS